MAETEPDEETSDRNRRQYERVKVAQPVRLQATLRGRFIDIMRLEMSGVTIDMSEGGFLANVDQSISPGVRCRVELPGEDGADPKTVWGRVRRTSSGSRGYFVALEFDEPIESTELPGGAELDDAESAEADEAVAATSTEKVATGK